MSDCRKCGNFRTVARFTFQEAGLTFVPNPIGSAEEDNVGLNHPDYYESEHCWRLMRDSVAGQDAIKRNAFKGRYVLVPPGLIDKSDEGKTCQSECEPTPEATNYIDRGRFPEVPLRHLLEVEGQLFNNELVVDGPDELLAVLDDIDAESLSFEERARSTTREYFKIYRELAYIQFNEEEGRPEVVWYKAESIVNWKIGDDGFPVLIVLEENISDGGVFSHETKARRIVLSIEEGRFNYRTFEIIEDEWTEISASIPTRNGDTLERIPAVMFGSWDLTPPPLKPIVETCIDYFRADTEWAHSLYYSAHPTLYANIDENGSILSADIGEDGEPLPYSIDIGAACAHIFRGGILAYAETSGASHAALKDRVLERRNELAGLGARSFVNYAASNITAMTEGLQQSGERGVLSSFARDISARFTEVLIWVAEWMGLPIDDVEVTIDQSQSDSDFDLRVLPAVYELLDRGVIGTTRLREWIRCNEPKLTGGLTDEEIDREMASENAGFGAADILGEIPVQNS